MIQVYYITGLAASGKTTLSQRMGADYVIESTSIVSTIGELHWTMMNCDPNSVITVESTSYNIEDISLIRDLVEECNAEASLRIVRLSK